MRYRGYWWDGWDNALSGSKDQGWDGAALPWYGLGPREYDPALGRFLQPDPASQDGVRSYVYAADAPLDLSDPNGQAGTPLECGQQRYVDQGNNVTSCGWQALRAQQEAGAQAALWAVPNFLLLDPLRTLTGAHSSLGTGLGAHTDEVRSDSARASRALGEVGKHASQWVYR